MKKKKIVAILEFILEDIDHANHKGRILLEDALSLLDDIPEDEELQAGTLERILLNGARDWKQYSFNGCALCYNHQLAQRYFPELMDFPEKWNGIKMLQKQANSLRSACYLIIQQLIVFDAVKL